MARAAVSVDFKFDNKLGPKIAAVEHAQQGALDIARDAIIAAILKSTPRRTGHLASSIRELAREGDSVFVGTDVFYARFLEYGTHAHIIEPTAARRAAAGGKQLALFWEGAEHPVGQVLHPGDLEHPFMLFGKQRARRVIPRRVEAYLKAILKL